MLLLALSRRQLMMFYRSKVKRGITFVVCSACCRLYAGGLRVRAASRRFQRTTTLFIDF